MMNTIETKVDLGGYSIYLKRSGSGTPTILLESGYGESSKTWDSIFNEIAKFTTVYAYDRAGLGRSDESPLKKTSENISTELYTLINVHSIHTPLILVGHSFGGMNCRIFATKYPDLVAGLILIDTTHENYMTEFLPTMSDEFQFKYNIQFKAEGNYKDFEESLEQVMANRKHLGDIPVYVIAAGKKKHYSHENQKLWNQLQTDLTTLSTNSKLIKAKNSAHYIHIEEPDLIVKSIKEIISE